MIIDLEKFLADERPAWAELELLLKKLEEEPNLPLTLEQAQRFHYLYQRASADLARLMTFAHEPAMRVYLESLVARAYGEIHETRYKKEPWRPWVWLSRTFPQTFRRYQREFLLSLVVTLAGSAFGGLAGWLLPHGSVEIPAILLAGQAGFVLAGALIGWGERTALQARLRSVAADVVTLISGVALMLVWAGIVEAFLSQYHEPILPYLLKIAFGTVELTALFLFLAMAGRTEKENLRT